MFTAFNSVSSCWEFSKSSKPRPYKNDEDFLFFGLIKGRNIAQRKRKNKYNFRYNRTLFLDHRRYATAVISTFVILLTCSGQRYNQ